MKTDSKALRLKVLEILRTVSAIISPIYLIHDTKIISLEIIQILNKQDLF